MKKIWNSTIRTLPTALKAEFKGFLKKYSYSVLFWNGLIYLIFIIIACIDLESACALSLFGSLVFFISTIDDVEDDSLLWTPLTFLFWLLILFMLILYICSSIYENTIVLFNKWLNGLKKKE